MTPIARAGTLTLAWDTNPDPALAGYRIYYGGASGVYTNMVDAGNVTNVTVSNLVAGATYFFAATDYDSNNLESVYSPEVSGTVPLPNTPPSISSVPSQLIAAGTSAGPISFTVSDAETPATNLVVTAASDNLTLVPVSNIAFGGSGTNRTVTVTPTSGAQGIANITLSVSDGAAVTSTTFQLSVEPRPQPPMNLRIGP